ncbi:MAG: aminopeptidase P family protein [Candidatus Riflebacteria bacterium]|nr:aminopeptidase P family protein [Candidatus Riflebacteria bacterium]
MDYKSRIKMLRDQFTSNYTAMLVTNLANIRYLCGYSGSNGTLVVTKRKAFFFTDFRYAEQSKKEVGDAAEIVVIQKNAQKVIYDRIKKLGIKAIAIEKTMSLGKFIDFSKNFTGELVPTEGLVESIRQIKQKEEETLLKKAFKIADNAFAELMKVIKPGLTEIEVAAKLEFFMKSAGSSMPSFDTIVASGPNAACPHHQPTDRVLKKGEMVKIDFGATFKGYHSDMTRTIFLGKASKEFKKIYGIVLDAQKKSIEYAKIGVKCADVDAVAREIITKAGYGENFGHGLGHSLGLDIHESPSLSASCNDIIKENHIFTFEPGIYLPGWGGVRIEDVYMIKKSKLVRYTNTPNELLEISC